MPPEVLTPKARRVAKKALKFVYPNIQVIESRITPELAVLALLLARGLDSTSRVTYGIFELYSGLVKGIASGTLAVSKIPDTILDSVEKALADSDKMRWNPLAKAAIYMKVPPDLVRKHLHDPATFHLPVPLRINPELALDRFIWRI